MIKWLKKRKENTENRKKLKQYKKYYNYVKAGQAFLQFIFEDIAQQKKDKVNRAQRRRFEKTLRKEGKLTPEMVQHYRMKIENVLRYIDMQINPPKVKKGKLPKVNTSTAPQIKQPIKKTLFNDDISLIAEYKLIREKKSNLPKSERDKVVSLYDQKFGCDKAKPGIKVEKASTKEESRVK